MISFDLSDAARAVLNKYGVTLEAPPLWWGALPGLLRCDTDYGILSAERRAKLDTMSRAGETDPGSLKRSDHAFYCGVLAETAAYVTAATEGRT